MRVLIVARTKAKKGRCIGGLARDGRSLRLLPPNGFHFFPEQVPFQVGEVWELSCVPSRNLTPPHIEDVLVRDQEFIGRKQELRDTLLARITPWEGGIEELFDGHLRFTKGGSGYISQSTGLPGMSTGFWIPDRDLALDGEYCFVRGYGPRRKLKYVGEAPAIPRIPAGTLVRVSLARWWKGGDAQPEEEERCYLQLSGWFLEDDSDHRTASTSRRS